MTAEILSYPRTHGLFAGVNLSGGVIRASGDDNRELDGSMVTPRQVLVDHAPPPPAVVAPFMKALARGM